MPFEFSSGFGVNSLIWISSLSSEQQGPTRRIVEDLQPWFAQIGLPFIRYDPKSANDLDQLLDGIAQRAREGAKSMLHLDMHGSKQGLQLAGTLEIAPWTSVIPRLQAISIATGNNLVVVAGVCFARHAILQIKISEACPVYMLIAPETEVTFGFLEDNTVPFYRELFSAGDVNKACLEHFGDPMKVFHCEQFLGHCQVEALQRGLGATGLGLMPRWSRCAIALLLLTGRCEASTGRRDGAAG